MVAHAGLLSFLIVVVGFTFILASHPDCEGSGEMDPGNEASRITAEQGTSRKRSRSKVSDIEKAQIQWEPDDLGKYNLSSLKLAYRSNGEWDYDTAPKFFSKYVWNVARKPCLNYEYQVIVPLQNENATFCTHTKTLEAEDKETIRKAHVKLELPKATDIVTAPNSKNVSIAWPKTTCAEIYDVFISIRKAEDGSPGEGDGEDQDKIVDQPDEGTNTVNVEFGNLQSCTKYDVEIVPKLKSGEYYDFETTSFTTRPDRNSAALLSLPPPNTQTTSMTLSFYTWMPKVNCLKNFTIETCNTDNDCFNSQDFSNVETHAGVKYESNELEHCTNYLIKIKPTHLGVDIEPRIVRDTTKLDEKASFMPEFRTSNKGVEIVVNHTRCFDYFTVKYTHKEDMDSDNADGNAKVFQKHQPIIIENLTPNTTYYFSMDGHQKDRPPLLLFEAQEFKTRPAKVFAIGERMFSGEDGVRMGESNSTGSQSNFSLSRRYLENNNRYFCIDRNRSMLHHFSKRIWIYLRR